MIDKNCARWMRNFANSYVIILRKYLTKKSTVELTAPDSYCYTIYQALPLKLAACFVEGERRIEQRQCTKNDDDKSHLIPSLITVINNNNNNNNDDYDDKMIIINQ